MDTAQIRHQNFLELFRQFRDQNSHLPQRGMLKLFAERLDLSDRYLSHIKTGRKNIGANVARQIETRLKLTHGWLDNVHKPTSEPSSSAEENFLHTALSLYRSNPVEAQAMMLEFLQRRLEVQKK
jgi:transcriptional regulator with XRE-family HTH domain